MNDMKRDLIRIQELVGMAFSETGSLVALADGGQMSPNKLQKTLEKPMEQFERTTLELRRLCERYSPGAGGFAHRPALPYMDITGSVETFGYGWLHITLHTLLPHCRYQTPNWLSDTIRCLLDEYETCGKKLPFYSRAMLVIDEHTGIEGRHIYDQDNKGWKAISNAIKGRLALNMRAATLRCFLWRMLTTSLRHTPVIMPAKTSIPDNGAECKSANRGRHPTDTCTNSIFSVACSTAADLLGNKAAKSIETACDFIRRRQQKIYTYLPTMRG